MIELILVAQLNTSQPQVTQQPQDQSTYKAPVYQQQSAPSSVPSSKQIEEFEEKIFETTK